MAAESEALAEISVLHGIHRNARDRGKKTRKGLEERKSNLDGITAARSSTMELLENVESPKTDRKVSNFKIIATKNKRNSGVLATECRRIIVAHPSMPHCLHPVKITAAVAVWI